LEHLIFSDPPLADEAILRRGREVIRLEADALRKLESTIDESFVAACGLIAGATHRLVITGIGKSGHVARKLAATFAATGTPAIYLHPAEAAHGDLGMLVRGDVLLVMSNSGNTSELRAVIDRRGVSAPLVRDRTRHCRDLPAQRARSLPFQHRADHVLDDATRAR
jgi:arabinose-5-phosphate isomerase